MTPFTNREAAGKALAKAVAAKSLSDPVVRGGRGRARP